MIVKELRHIGYEFSVEEPNDLVDLIEEIYDCIIGEHPEAVLTLTKEFDRGIAFYFKRCEDDFVYKQNRSCISIGFNKEGWLRPIPRKSEPENIGAVTGKIRWLT